MLQEKERRIRGKGIPGLEVFASFHARGARKAFARLPRQEQRLLRHLELARIEEIAEEPAPRRRDGVGDRYIHYRALPRAFNAHASRSDALLAIAVQREEVQGLQRWRRGRCFPRGEGVRHRLGRAIEAVSYT